MSYTTLNTLSSAFSSAVDTTTGLDSYLMIDSSELNAHHNIDYPVCVVEPPSSSVSNINKAWEDYDVSCFVLQVDDSSVDNVIQYDTCLSLFTSFLANLMKQRDGEYVLDKDSVSIERIRGEGNDNLIGVKVGFNLLVPSVLIETNPQGVDLPTTQSSNLLAYWDLSDHESSVDYDSVKTDRPIWSPSLGSQSYELKSLDEHIPFLNKPSKEFVFYKGDTASTRGVGMWSEDFSSSSNSFSVFALINTERNKDLRSRLIMRVSDDTHSDKSGLYIKEESSELEYYVRGTKAGETSGSKAVDGKYKVVGFVNDGATDRVDLYNGYDRKVCPDSADATAMSNMLLYLGAYAPASNRSALDDELFEGNIKAVIVYESALTKNEVNEVTNHLMNLL